MSKKPRKTKYAEWTGVVFESKLFSSIETLEIILVCAVTKSHDVTDITAIHNV